MLFSVLMHYEKKPLIWISTADIVAGCTHAVYSEIVMTQLQSPRAEKRKWQASQTGKLNVNSAEASERLCSWFHPVDFRSRAVSLVALGAELMAGRNPPQLACVAAKLELAVHSLTYWCLFKLKRFHSKQMKSTQKTSCIVPVDEILLVTSQHLYNSHKMLRVQQGLDTNYID